MAAKMPPASCPSTGSAGAHQHGAGGGQVLKEQLRRLIPQLVAAHHGAWQLLFFGGHAFVLWFCSIKQNRRAALSSSFTRRALRFSKRCNIFSMCVHFVVGSLLTIDTLLCSQRRRGCGTPPIPSACPHYSWLPHALPGCPAPRDRPPERGWPPPGSRAESRCRELFGRRHSCRRCSR